MITNRANSFFLVSDEIRPTTNNAFGQDFVCPSRPKGNFLDPSFFSGARDGLTGLLARICIVASTIADDRALFRKTCFSMKR